VKTPSKWQTRQPIYRTSVARWRRYEPWLGPLRALDLGLATVLPGADRDGASNAADSPTLTMGATEAGVIMGTAAYMSPEQASGRRVDKRADIWSFSVVLWEMLTGSRLFESGETVSDTLADVLRAKIDFGKLSGSTPQAIRQLLKRCLDRNVKISLRDIGEARIVLANPVASEPSPAVTAPSRSPLSWIVAAALLVALATVSFIHFREQPPEQQPLRYTIAPPQHSAQLRDLPERPPPGGGRCMGPFQ
jgi:serine/threonine-protein kinase